MRFVNITEDNFERAIQLKPKRSQYRFIRAEAVLYSMGRAYIAGHIPLVIEDDGKLIGAIRLRNYGHGVGFAAFFIDRKHQGKGLGKKAVLHLIDYVKEQFPKAGEIETAVFPENTVAARLYESVGFKYTGVVNANGTVDLEMQV